jgi:hypothetical protein
MEVFTTNRLAGVVSVEVALEGLVRHPAYQLGRSFDVWNYFIAYSPRYDHNHIGTS